MDRAAREQTRALLLAYFDVAFDLFPSRFVDQRSHLHALVEAVPDSDRPRALDQRFGHSPGDVAMNDHSAGRRTALPGGAEGPPEGAFDRELEIGVFHDDLGVLAAELQ